MKMDWFELSCKQASVLLSQAQEHRLGLLERSKLRLHLLACDGCTNFLKQLRFIRAAIRHYRDNGLSD
jgi:hypothetical protein